MKSNLILIIIFKFSEIDVEQIPSSCQLEHLDIQENPLTAKSHSLLSQIDKVKISLSPRETEEWEDLTV